MIVEYFVYKSGICINVMTRLFLEVLFENQSIRKPLFSVKKKLRPSGSGFRTYGLVLSDMYQVVLYVFSNETFPFFAKLEGG